MKAVKWEASAGALAAYLGSRPQSAIVCDLYTVALAGNLNGGKPLLFTTLDVDVVVPYAPGTMLVNTGPPLAAAPLASGPTTWSSQLIYFDQLMNKSYGHWKVGLDVDTWQVICTATPQATIGNQQFYAALRAGALKGAVIAVDRAFFDNRKGWPYEATATPLGIVNVFTGRVAEVDFGRSNAVISINSHLELLGIQVPHNLYQASCRWNLFGPGCTLNQASFGLNGTAAAAPAPNSSQLEVNVAKPGGSGTYALGQIVMTGGANAGYARNILAWLPGSPATFLLRSPFPFAAAPGDAFTAYPGCDKQLSTCTAFDNSNHFGGMPFIPVPELVQ